MAEKVEKESCKKEVACEICDHLCKSWRVVVEEFHTEHKWQIEAVVLTYEIPGQMKRGRQTS